MGQMPSPVLSVVRGAETGLFPSVVARGPPSGVWGPSWTVETGRHPGGVGPISRFKTTPSPPHSAGGLAPPQPPASQWQDLTRENFAPFFVCFSTEMQCLHHMQRCATDTPDQDVEQSQHPRRPLPPSQSGSLPEATEDTHHQGLVLPLLELQVNGITKSVFLRSTAFLTHACEQNPNDCTWEPELSSFLKGSPESKRFLGLGRELNLVRFGCCWFLILTEDLFPIAF